MSAVVVAFAEDHAPAERLAAALGIPHHPIHLHRFPDGEALPTVAAGHETVLLYRSLDRPDGKLMPLLLAADALRRGGAERIVLVAPYLPYLRQDQVFAAGQPLSRDVLGRLLDAPFDGLVTVQPHLHRTANLASVFPSLQVAALSTAELFAHAIGPASAPLIVGPDCESQPLIAEIAAQLRTDSLVFGKTREGDDDVRLRLPAGTSAAGRRAVLVDDICASGATLETAAKALHAAGALTVEVVVAHALFDEAAAARLRHAGVRRIVSTDSCRHPSNSLFLAGLLADALRKEI